MYNNFFRNSCTEVYLLNILPDKKNAQNSFSPAQEITDGRRVLCGNVVLDKQHDDLIQRVANRVYEDARGGHLKLCGFPDYGPVIAALQSTAPPEIGKEFQVTVKKHDRLVVLQALAAKWLDTEYKDEVTAAIESHNKKFNVGGEYWHETAETRLASSGEQNQHSITPMLSFRLLL